MKNIQIMFKQFQKIDQELNARFVKLRLTFQIYIYIAIAEQAEQPLWGMEFKERKKKKFLWIQNLLADAIFLLHMGGNLIWAG